MGEAEFRGGTEVGSVTRARAGWPVSACELGRDNDISADDSRVQLDCVFPSYFAVRLTSCDSCIPTPPCAVSSVVSYTIAHGMSPDKGQSRERQSNIGIHEM